MLDGVDIYNVNTGRLFRTIPYPLGERYVVGITFLNDDTIVAGHSRGRMIIAQFGQRVVMPPVMIEVFNILRELIILWYGVWELIW